MDTLAIPQAFAEATVRREGAAGRAWLDSLPGRVEHYCRVWSLELDGAPLHGHVALMLPVSRADGTAAMLKLSWLDTETRDEPIALAAWHGNGAVAVAESEPEQGALLLERLNYARTLAEQPIGYAVDVAGGLLRRLAIPAPPTLSRDLRSEAAQLEELLPRRWRALGEPVPRRLLHAAVEVCRQLGPNAGGWLVNEDLHYENVLAPATTRTTRACGGPWLAIDPKPITGDAEFGVIPLLWNRIDESTLDDRFSSVVAAADLDAERSRGWTLVRAVQNWLWAVAGGDDDFVLAAVTRIAPWAANGM